MACKAKELQLSVQCHAMPSNHYRAQKISFHHLQSLINQKPLLQFDHQCPKLLWMAELWLPNMNQIWKVSRLRSQNWGWLWSCYRHDMSESFKTFKPFLRGVQKKSKAAALFKMSSSWLRLTTRYPIFSNSEGVNGLFQMNLYVKTEWILREITICLFPGCTISRSPAFWTCEDLNVWI